MYGYECFKYIQRFLFIILIYTLFNNVVRKIKNCLQDQRGDITASSVTEPYCDKRTVWRRVIMDTIQYNAVKYVML